MYTPCNTDEGKVKKEAKCSVKFQKRKEKKRRLNQILTKYLKNYYARFQFL